MWNSMQSMRAPKAKERHRLCGLGKLGQGRFQTCAWPEWVLMLARCMHGGWSTPSTQASLLVHALHDYAWCMLTYLHPPS